MLSVTGLHERIGVLVSYFVSTFALNISDRIMEGL
jgi:hypothetical protein